MTTIQCDRCEKEFHRMYDDMRFRSGTFHDPVRGETYEQVCEDCARELRK